MDKYFNYEALEVYPGKFRPGDKVRYITGLDHIGFKPNQIYTIGLYGEYTTHDWAICIENDTQLVNHNKVYTAFELVVETKSKEEYDKKDKGWGF